MSIPIPTDSALATGYWNLRSEVRYSKKSEKELEGKPKSILASLSKLTRDWIRKYNEERPHDSLGDLTPMEYLVANKQAEISSNAWT